MTREEQLSFCKRCSFRKLDLKQGLICNIKGQKADFETECPDFEVDSKVIIDEKRKKEAIKSNKKRSKTAQILIWSVMIMDIISIISLYFKYNLLISLEKNDFVPDLTLNSSDLIEGIIAMIYLIVYITSVVTFIQWFRRAYYNLNIRTNCSHSDNWAVISWFIPIISLFRPYQIMKEMWLHTSELIIAKSNKKNKNGNGIIIFLWWILWIFSNFIGNYITRNLFKQEGIINLINTIKAEISLGIIGFTLAIITYIMIDKYSQKEEILRKLEKEIS